MLALIHTLGHAVERHVANKGLDSKKGETILNETWETVSTGFPLYGFPIWMVVLIGVGIIALLVAYSVAGKGQGSHAGREEIRRSYRRKLAQEMAKQDAEKIRLGEKPRRRWMQW